MNNKLKVLIESELGEEIKEFPSGTGIIRTNSGKEYFLKSGKSSRTYQCEANGLQELHKAKAFSLPEVISVGNEYLLTAYISPGTRKTNFFRLLGEQLAQLHRYQNDSYGFYEDNFIGANPQLNIPDQQEATDWITFYFNKRLLFQYKLAEKNGYLSSSLKHGFIKLESVIDSVLTEALEVPTLIHGDLWAGNYLCNKKGDPVLIDPAVYYGHREADLAMTKLFGGFTNEFYESYQQSFPLQEGWEKREGLYKLYHVMNHLNLFGYGYLSEAEYLISIYTK